MSKQIQMPSLGRVVLFRMNPSEDWEVAVVTAAWSHKTINVRVLHNDTRNPSHHTSVLHVDYHPSNYSSSAWKWPEHVPAIWVDDAGEPCDAPAAATK